MSIEYLRAQCVIYIFLFIYNANAGFKIKSRLLAWICRFFFVNSQQHDLIQ